MSVKAVTIVLHLDVPDDYGPEDLDQIRREIVAAVNSWPSSERVVDSEVAR